MISQDVTIIIQVLITSTHLIFRMNSVYLEEVTNLRGMYTEKFGKVRENTTDKNIKKVSKSKEKSSVCS